MELESDDGRSPVSSWQADAEGERFRRDGDGLVEAAGLGRAEHDDGLLAAGADGDGG
jgi:hypothetical protein